METYENMLIDFSALDRCDRCGAQACSKAERDDVASELLFCGHHFREVEQSLSDEGWTLTLGSNAPELLGFITAREHVST